MHRAAASRTTPDLEQLEIELLLEGVYRHYGFDFRAYAYASLRRRALEARRRRGAARRSPRCRTRVLHDPEAMERLLLDLSVNVTAMFRDPTFYSAFREKVVPLLRTYPFIRIWHAGCSTGEEVYSMAILLAGGGALRPRAHLRDRHQRGGAAAGASRRSSRSTGCRSTRENYIRAGGTRVVLASTTSAKYDGALFEPRADARTSSSRSTTSSPTGRSTSST